VSYKIDYRGFFPEEQAICEGNDVDDACDQLS
jgi:hypothetical protein